MMDSVAQERIRPVFRHLHSQTRMEFEHDVTGVSFSGHLNPLKCFAEMTRNCTADEVFRQVPSCGTAIVQTVGQDQGMEISYQPCRKGLSRSFFALSTVVKHSTPRRHKSRPTPLRLCNNGPKSLKT